MVSDDWLQATGSSEQSFSMGSFEDNYIRACPVMALHGPDGKVAAFANLYPEYRRNEATVDLMRRRTGSENGTMEMLCAALLDWAKAEGYDTFNLGLCPLAGIGEAAHDPAAERALRSIFEHSRRFYNFKGLHDFKAKFHPQWSPRFLVYPGPASLPAVALATVRAHAGDDFLWRYLRAGRPARECPPQLPVSIPSLPLPAAEG